MESLSNSKISTKFKTKKTINKIIIKNRYIRNSCLNQFQLNFDDIPYLIY